MELKTCKSCNQSKELSDFYIRKNKYINSKCKKCSIYERVESQKRATQFIKTLPTESNCEDCNETKSIKEFRIIKSSCFISTKCNSCKSKLKRCYSCKEELSVDDFGMHKSYKGGRMNICRSCKSKVDRRYRDQDPLKTKLRKREYYNRIKNEDWYKEKNSKRVRNYKNEYIQQQKDTFKYVKAHLRKVILVYIKKQKNKVGPKPKTEDILGIDFDGFVNHIEKQFISGMSWNNHGKWHIDHILPCALSNGDTDILLKLFNYQNLSPVWAFDNLSKNDKVLDICCLWDSPFPEFNRKK